MKTWILVGWMGWAAAAAASDVSVFGSLWKGSETDARFGGGVKLALTEKGQETLVELRLSAFDDLGPDAVEESLFVLPVELGLRFPIADTGALFPYLGLGGGYYWMDYGDLSVDDAFGGYGLFGLQWTFHPRGFVFTEVLYRYVQTESTVGDLDLSGLGVNAGVGLAW
jgi:hypothetical protein